MGGKNASLGEMYLELSGQGVSVPDGFTVTASAYWHVVERGGILDELNGRLDKTDVADLTVRGKKACDLIIGQNCRKTYEGACSPVLFSPESRKPIKLSSR